MGLDMYLYANKYVARKDYNNKAGEFDYATNRTFAEIVSLLNAESIIDNEWSGIHIDLPVGYWRKANQVHGWIVANCADGVDDCQRIYVPKAKAEELVSICKQVLADHSLAEELLAPQTGFFFGSYDIDQWYLQDLERTIEIFEKLRVDEEVEVDGETVTRKVFPDNIFYQASW